MSVFLRWALPMPVVASPGATEVLSTILTDSFGTPNAWSDLWVTYYPASQLQAWDFRYWNPSKPSVATWYVNGTDIGGGFNNQTYVPGSAIGTAGLLAGNDIGPFAYVTVPAGTSATESIEYSIITIDPHVLSSVAGHGEPTPNDIVNTAYRFAGYYGTV